MRKRLSLCLIQQRSVCSDCLALTELTRMSKPNCLYGEKFARLKISATLKIAIFPFANKRKTNALVKNLRHGVLVERVEKRMRC